MQSHYLLETDLSVLTATFWDVRKKKEEKKVDSIKTVLYLRSVSKVYTTNIPVADVIKSIKNYVSTFRMLFSMPTLSKRY